MPVKVKSEDDGGGGRAYSHPSPPRPMNARSSAKMDIDSDDTDDSIDHHNPVTSKCPTTTTNDEDDPIVRQVDVYLSPALADQIYLLQYPLQQAQMHRLPTAARIKPRHAQIELDYPIAVATASASAGAAAGSQPGGSAAYCRGAFPFMTSRLYQSQTIPVETHMCLGQLEVDEADYTKSSLHLVPLQHISQMRPSFNHVENPDDNAAAGADQDNKDDEDDDDNINDAGVGEVKPIVFQRKESERAAMIRKSSYAYKKASHEAEEWQDLIVCAPPFKSDEYTSNLNQIIVPLANQKEAVLASLRNNNNMDTDDNDNDDDSDNHDWTVAGMNYIQSLNYVKVSAQEEDNVAGSATSAAAAAAAAADTVGSASSINNNNDIKSIVARMTVLLGNGGPIPYSILRDQFVTATTTAAGNTGNAAFGVSDAKLFQALSICAVLVRGNFCLHSKFLSLSKSMQRARTFLLLLFQKYKMVQKSKLQKIDLQLLVGNDTNSNEHHHQVITLHKLNVLLHQVGKRTNAIVNAIDTNPAGWELRVEDNLAFVAAYPQEAAQHLTYWDRLCTSSSPRIVQLLEQYNNATTTTGEDNDNDDEMMH